MSHGDWWRLAAALLGVAAVVAAILLLAASCSPVCAVPTYGTGELTEIPC